VVRLCLKSSKPEGYIFLALAAFVHIKLVSYVSMVSISAASVSAKNRLPWVLSRFVNYFCAGSNGLRTNRTGEIPSKC